MTETSSSWEKKALGHRKSAKRLLVYYFRLALENAGVNWHDDNRAEVEEIVDLLFAGMIAMISDIVPGE